MLGQNRGTSRTAATMSRASRLASATPPSVSSASRAPTSSRMVAGVGQARAARSLIETLFHIGDAERVQERVDLALQHPREIMHGEPYAMIGDAVLGEVVGADLRGPVARADLRLPHARSGRLTLGEAHVEQAGAEHFHRLELVLKLRLLVLLGDDEA